MPLFSLSKSSRLHARTPEDLAMTFFLCSGKVQGKLRGLVSQNRRRFLKHGFDLDCTYITNRVSSSMAD